MSLGREKEPIGKIRASVLTLADRNKERLKDYLETIKIEYPWECLFLTQFYLVWKDQGQTHIIAPIRDVFLMDEQQDGFDSTLGEWA